MHLLHDDADKLDQVADPEISIIIPALNEGPNLAPLAEQIAAALPGRGYEIIIVDDNSADGTPAICETLSKTHPLRLIVRADPKDGLSGAVLRGIAEARGQYLVVMDADLQHPPDKLPELLAPLTSASSVEPERNEADFVLGSRYVPGGSTAERWGFLRQLNSRAATFLARPFAGKTTDPMSGFFAMRRSTFDAAQRLTPLGYKIGLELMCKARVKNVREIPIHFAQRVRGESKLTLKEQFRYLEHLSRLYDFTFPRASPVVKFLIVLMVSWLVALAAYLALIAAECRPLAAAATLAYGVAILATAVFHLRYVRTQREFLVRQTPWRDFLLISLTEWIACALTAYWVARRMESPTLADLFFIPFTVATVVRYILRKELLQDVRGLRKEIRRDELEPLKK